MPEIVNAACYWTILHRGHHAWYQRSLLAGDFRPGLTPRSEYIVDVEGRNADPAAVPRCSTCSEIPDVNDLEPMDRESGERGFLDRYRAADVRRREPWPKPTANHTCWHCNCPGPVDEAGMCGACARFLAEDAQRQELERKRLEATARAAAEQDEEPPTVALEE